MPEGGDRCQPAQLNAYRISHYKPDCNQQYQAFLRELSWVATPANVPQHAQASQLPHVAKGMYSPLHPVWRTSTALVSFHDSGSPKKSRAQLLPPLTMAYSRPKTDTGGLFPTLSTSDLRPSTYRGPKSHSRKLLSLHQIEKSIKSTDEAQGDTFFKEGAFAQALAKYTAALSECKNDTWVLTKRCAVYAHLGEYYKALEDAHAVLMVERSAKAQMRLNALTKFLNATDACGAGYATSHITLLQSVTPSVFKQW